MVGIFISAVGWLCFTAAAYVSFCIRILLGMFFLFYMQYICFLFWKTKIAVSKQQTLGVDFFWLVYPDCGL